MRDVATVVVSSLWLDAKRVLRYLKPSSQEAFSANEDDAPITGRDRGVARDTCVCREPGLYNTWIFLRTALQRNACRTWRERGLIVGREDNAVIDPSASPSDSR